jgi:hypothetical protein
MKKFKTSLFDKAKVVSWDEQHFRDCKCPICGKRIAGVSIIKDSQGDVWFYQQCGEHYAAKANQA